MITQKDVHNQIVDSATTFQKACLVLCCKINDISVEELEQNIATIVNGVAHSIEDANMQYLSTKLE